MPRYNLPSDKELKRKGRGAHVEKECSSDNAVVRVVKWYDSKSVTLLTIFASVRPVSTIKRWDRIAKRKNDVPCPTAVNMYNKLMGGVDLLDSLIGLYRIKLRSKKYYHRIFFHFLDLTIVTAWLLYRRDCDDLGIPNSKQKPLLEFKCAISGALSKQNQVMSRKRGRPSTEVQINYEQKKVKVTTPSQSHRRLYDWTMLTIF